MQVRKVKYVAGSGCMLQYPLSDGQFSFKAGIEYEIPNSVDFHRLMETSDFEEVKTKEAKPKVEPTVEAKESEVLEENPLKDFKKKGDNK